MMAYAHDENIIFVKASEACNRTEKTVPMTAHELKFPAQRASLDTPASATGLSERGETGRAALAMCRIGWGDLCLG